MKAQCAKAIQSIRAYLEPWQPLRSMSSSGVDSIIACTSDFSVFSMTSTQRNKTDSWTRCEKHVQRPLVTTSLIQLFNTALVETGIWLQFYFADATEIGVCGCVCVCETNFNQTRIYCFTSLKIWTSIKLIRFNKIILMDVFIYVNTDMLERVSCLNCTWICQYLDWVS